MKLFLKKFAILPLLSFMLLLGCAVLLQARPVLADDASSTLQNDVCSNVDPADKPSICQSTQAACASAQDKSTKLECKSDDPIVTTILKGVRLVDIAIGIVAVISIIIGGLRYILSRGDSGQIETAKNTILYAVIGLAVALSAQVIIAFALNRIK
jgi:hypothetical protein